MLGESLAPFRILNTVTAVIPLDGMQLLDASAAASAGHRHLAAWLRDAEAKWAEHSARRGDGGLRMTLRQRIDHMHELSSQAGPPSIRVLYTKSGTRLSAAAVMGGDALIDHTAYWATARSQEEAGYLLAVLNSAAVLAKITDLQPHGQRDRRHFDNLVWTLPIPEYDPAEAVHRDLAAASARATDIAEAVALVEGQHFTGKRSAIRAALVEAGVAAEIEALVDALLPT